MDDKKKAERVAPIINFSIGEVRSGQSGQIMLSKYIIKPGRATLVTDILSLVGLGSSQPSLDKLS